MSTYIILKNGKMVADYSEGKQLTESLKKAEKYTSYRSALKAVEKYEANFGGQYKIGWF